jgi:hypothetical protein
VHDGGGPPGASLNITAAEGAWAFRGRKVGTMSRKHQRNTTAPTPAADPLVKMHEDLIARYNNLELELEQRMGNDAGQMSESWNDLDWANRVDKDYLWVRTSGANTPQFRYMTKEIIDMYADIANFMAMYNPLIKRIVEVKTQFTFAMNCGITSEKLQTEIDTILTDPLNKMAFFGPLAIGDSDGAAQKDGNIFFAIWKAAAGRPAAVRAWSSYEFRDVVLDSEDSARPLFYLRSWTGTDGKERKRAYPSLFLKKDEMRDRKTALSYLGSSYEVDQEIVVYHMSSRKGIRQKFAPSELVAACRWAKPHEKFIEDFHAIASAYRKYSHMMTTKGSAAQASAIAGQFQGDTNNMGTPLQSNPVGSVVVAQEGNELKTISAGSGNIIGIEGARASLMQVCAASGVPETYLTMDPSTGNLATAKEISPVFIMLIEFRQTIWKDALTAVFKYLLESDDFEVSFPPIRDNLNQYILNMNSIAKKPDGSWSGAVRGADYVKASYEALEWKLPPKEEVEEMGAALEETPDPEPASSDKDLTDIALAAQDITRAANQQGQQNPADPASTGTPPSKQPVPPALQAFKDKHQK